MNSVRLKRIEMFEVVLEPSAPLVAAHGTIGERTIILVRVWDDQGVPGWGECIAQQQAGYLSETTATVWKSLHNGVIPAAMSRQFASPDELSEYLAGAMRQTPIASAPVEMAAWDVLARRQGRSLSNLFGGTRSNVAAGRTIGFPPAGKGLAGYVAEARRAGYQRIKVKVEPKRALSLAAEAKKSAERTPVVVDANGSFSPRDLQGLRELDSLNLTWIEQPYPAASLRATAELRDSLLTPIALDESFGSLNSLERIIDANAASALSLKPGRLGGHGAALAAYRRAKAAGIHLWIGGMLETGIGRAHNLALASLPGFDLVGDMAPSEAYWKRDLLTTPIEMVAGHIAVPEMPGIGVDVDMDYIRAATVRREVFG